MPVRQSVTVSVAENFWGSAGIAARRLATPLVARSAPAAAGEVWCRKSRRSMGALRAENTRKGYTYWDAGKKEMVSEALLVPCGGCRRDSAELDQFQAGEKISDFKRGGIRSIGAVGAIVADAGAEIVTNGSRSGFFRVGRAH